jgi:hypothetical protein
LKLAQKLYEEELVQQYSDPQPTTTQPFQSTYISPYHIPPPQKPVTTTTSTIKNNSALKTNTNTKANNMSNALLPNKRQAVGKDSEAIKKSSAGTSTTHKCSQFLLFLANDLFTTLKQYCQNLVFIIYFLQILQLNYRRCESSVSLSGVQLGM